MRKVAIIFCAALFVGLPTVSHAQYNDNDQQNPKEYTDEDSQPLELFADILYPVGYALEWAIARPMHYLSHNSSAAPIFRPVGGDDMSPPPPVPIIPDNTMDEVTTFDDTAGLVPDAQAPHDQCDRGQTGRTTGSAAAPVERPADASLNFRISPGNIAIVAILPSLRGLSSPLNVAYL